MVEQKNSGELAQQGLKKRYSRFRVQRISKSFTFKVHNMSDSDCSEDYDGDPFFQEVAEAPWRRNDH